MYRNVHLHGGGRRLALASLAFTTLLAATGCAVRAREYPAPVETTVPAPPSAEPEYPPGPMPAPIVEAPSAPPSTSGWSWLPGHWEWAGHHWRWERGHWVNEAVAPMPPVVEEDSGPPPSSSHVWIRGHWRWGGHGWVWVGGTWVLR